MRSALASSFSYAPRRASARMYRCVVPSAAVGVVDVRPDSEGQVARQSPRGGGPGQHLLAGLQVEHHRQRRILAVLVDVVHPRLGVGERGLAAPAVGQHAEALVDQPLVEQGLERPHHALHVGRVERLVVVLEVHPAGLAGDIAVPVVGEPQHAGATGVVELVQPELDDLRVAADAEFLLHHRLGGKAVAVPPEPAVHLLAAHGAVAGHGVLHEAGEEVPVVGQAVGEGRAVVEDVLVGAVAGVDRGRERPVGVPVGEDLALESGERRLRRHIGVGHWLLLHGVGLGDLGNLDQGRADGPRYHPACRHPRMATTRIRQRCRAGPVRFY